MRRVIAVLGVLAVAALPAHTHAWGYEAHKFIMERAIGLLPALPSYSIVIASSAVLPS